MAGINNLPITLTVSAGDLLPVFINNQGILMGISINTLASFMATNYPGLLVSAALSSLPKQTNAAIAPVETGQPYINTDGAVVIAQ